MSLWRSILLAATLASFSACALVAKPPAGFPPTTTPAATSISAVVDPVAQARMLANNASHAQRPEFARRDWLQCAVLSYRSMRGASDPTSALGWYQRCTEQLVDDLLETDSDGWTSRVLSLGQDKLQIAIAPMPASLHGALQLVPARQVAIPESFDRRYERKGIGVALVAVTRRCNDRSACRLYPPEGVTRAVTAWIDLDDNDQPRLRIADPLREPSPTIGARQYPLAMDATAPYALLFDQSKLKRLAIWNLIGGKQIGQREGLYLLEDYDPNKIPVVMIHGLGASPLIWGRLTNRIFGTPALRERYQVWHVVYQSNAPVLLNRLRVQQFLDRGWQWLDPSGAALARRDMVLIGHSMGGVIARLLCAESGDLLWRTAFTVPPEQMPASEQDMTMLKDLFFFHPYPGVERAVFMASPHLGSPLSERFLGRIAVLVLNPRAPELDALRRLSTQHPAVVQSALLAIYQSIGLSSVSTLRKTQPVSHAAQNLMPAPGIRYYTIAGERGGAGEPGDGVVPLSSAVIPGAVSTTIVDSGHKVYNNDKAVEKTIEILGEAPVVESVRRDALSQ
ncbi:MAG TPA: alpha/beta hydrolase [Dyella sp.]|uniref:esterase/lipase family protein n=1 Tax=Dyella sp. TaxID=1869338 RepID=UPI002F956603